MSASGPHIRAIVVTTGRTGFLGETLAALAAQDRKIDSWHLVVVGGSRSEGDDLGVPVGLGIPVTGVDASTFGEAIDAVLRQNPGDNEWLWLLHDDSAPFDQTLSRLLAVSRKRRAAGVIGPVQVRWDDPTRLVSVGVTVSRSGRRFNTVEQDDLDQGQHEGREDVLAVGFAGALVKRDVWERLGGTDPAYGVFGDSTDFCRRTWRLGQDVVLAPRARIRHAQATLLGHPDKEGRRKPSHDHRQRRLNHTRLRTSEWYHALAWAKAWSVPFILARVGLSSVGRALVRVAAGEPRMAMADLAVPLTLVAQLRYLRRSRAAIARAGRQPVERPLLARVMDMMGFIRTREFGLYEAWRAENRPNDVQRRELAHLRVRRRWTLAGVAIVLAGLSLALYGTWLAPIFRGDMLVGTALGVTDVSVNDLWERSWTGWSDQGFGGGALDGSFAALMIPFALVPGGLAMGIGLLLALSPLFAGLTAWCAAGAATRSLTTRVLAAIAWGAWPTLMASVADGRVGSVLVHILLPLLAYTLAKATSLFRRDVLGDAEEFPRGRIGSPVAGAAAAVLMVAITISAPILLAPLVLIGGVLALGVKGHRRRMAFILVPALVVQGPALWQTWQHRGNARWWSLLVREPGPALPSDPVSSWDLLWGVGEAPPPWPAATETGNLILTYFIGAVLVGAAILALASKRSPLATRLGWLIAGGGLASAIVAQRTTAVSLAADGSVAANGWPGPGQSMLALGLMLAVLAASSGFLGSSGTPRPDTPALSSAGRRLRRGRKAVTVVVASLVAVHVTATAWPGRDFGGDVHPAGVSVLPLVADLERSSQPMTRVLLLRSLEDGTISFTVTGSDGDSSLLGRAFLVADGRWPTGSEDAGDLSLISPAVSSLVGSGDGAGVLLREWGIGVVVVAPDSAELEGPLLLIDDLALIGVSELGASWRVLPPASAGNDVKITRAWTVDPTGFRSPLRSEPSGLRAKIPEGDEDRTLVMAVPTDPRWWSTLNGVSLNPVDLHGRQGFALGSSSGHLEMGYYDPEYRAWWLAGAAMIIWALLGAVPLRDRTYRKERQ